MGEICLPPIVPIEYYNETESKFAASVRWVISRVYENAGNIPDKLRNGVIRDDTGKFHIDVAVLVALANGSLYSQAAAKIFKEPHLVNQSHGAVLAVLTDYGIDVVQRAEEGGMPVSEQELITNEPFHKLAHLAVIDALMLAHLRNVVTVERVVDAVGRQTSVDDRERPMDSADALLFWINKICLLVRDDVEHSQIVLKGGEDGGMIPEMEDLYDEISDGQCLCALLAFYRPRELQIEDVCFNDNMSNADCQYNLTLIREFCHNGLQTNPFHMEIEDLLYLHDSMQMNVNVFLADLFDVLEPAPIIPQQPEVVLSPRRFVPIHAIPDLRAANSAARSPHPPRVRNPFNNIQVSQTTPSRSMSVMSQDSLMTNRNATWGRSPVNRMTPELGGNVTNFGRLPTYDAGSNGNISQSGQYTRSDSLPAASIRMALEEKRREHEKRKMMQSTMSESERAEKTKAAFFAVMNQAKLPPPSPETKMLTDMSDRLSRIEDLFQTLRIEREMDQNSRMSRAVSQPSVYQDAVPPNTARSEYGTLPHGASMMQQPPPYSQQYDYYGQQGMQPQQQYQVPGQPLRSSLSNGMINYLPGHVPTGYDYSQIQGGIQPGFGSPMMQQQQQPAAAHLQQQQQPQGFNLMHQSAHAATGGFAMHQPQAASSMMPMQQQQEISQMYQQQQHQMGYPTEMYGQPQQAQIPQSTSFTSYAGTPVDGPPRGGGFDNSDAMSMVSGYDAQGHDGGNTFRLHSHDASSSRLDPPLELNRNLINWGMTMKAGHTSRPQRRTWENQTFIKSGQDLVNNPELVPVVPNGDEFFMQQQQQQQRRSPSVVGSTVGSRRSRDSRDEMMTSDKVSDPEPLGSHSSPPRDPGSTKENTNGFDTSRSSAPAGPAFLVDQVAEDFDKIAEQRREARRAALLAKTNKRKEEMENKADLLEQRNLEKKLAEEAKKEAAEQRKIEKEIQRQKIFEEYKKRKEEKDRGLEPSSARSTASAGGRGHSQPPFIRTKSQMTESTMSHSARPTPRPRGASTVEIKVASLQEPTHKVFVKPTTKSNRGLIINALQYAVFPGAVNKDHLVKAMNDLAGSDAKHFLIHFRDHKCQYRGLYSWDQQSDSVEKISGQGPTKLSEESMKFMFKYDSGGKSFSQIPTKHLGATIDGFALQDSFWQKPKIPHSAPAHRNN